MQRKPRIKLSPAKYKKLVEEVLIRDRYRCQGKDCPGGFPLDPPHHKIFRSAGGSDVAENLTLLCTHCHSARHGINRVNSKLSFK